MKREKKIGSAVLVVLLSLGCTTTTMEKYYLFLGTGRDNIREWSISKDGKTTNELTFFDKEASGLIKISPNGKYLASSEKGSWKVNINIWDVTDPEKVQKLLQSPKKHDGVVSSLAFSFNSQYFASADRMGNIHLSDVSKGFKWLKTFKGVKGYTYLAFRSDGPYLDAVTLDIQDKKKNKIVISRLDLRDLQRDKKERRIIPVPEIFGLSQDDEPVAVFSPDGKYFALVHNFGDGLGNAVIVFEISLNHRIKRLQTFTLTGEEMAAIVFSPDSQYLALGSYTQFIRILHLSSGTFKKVSRFEIGDVRTMAFSHDGTYFAASLAGSVGMWYSADNWKNVNKVKQKPVMEWEDPEEEWNDTALAFWPGLEPYFHLKDPGLRGEKMELLEELKIMVETPPKVPEGLKRLLEKDIDGLRFFRALKKLTHWYKQVKQNLTGLQTKFPGSQVYLTELKTKLESEYTKTKNDIEKEQTGRKRKRSETEQTERSKEEEKQEEQLKKKRKLPKK